MMLLSCLAWTGSVPGDVGLLYGGLCDCGRAPRPITAALATPDILPPREMTSPFCLSLWFLSENKCPQRMTGGC
jgi:hypothetical protein